MASRPVVHVYFHLAVPIRGVAQTSLDVSSKRPAVLLDEVARGILVTAQARNPAEKDVVCLVPWSNCAVIRYGDEA